jgi:hypothetical protein
MRRLLLAWSFVLCACTDSSSPAFEIGDGTFGAACSKPDNMSPDCDSQICTGTIDDAGHPVCSQLCTKLQAPDDSCPIGLKMGRYCNRFGYCRP